MQALSLWYTTKRTSLRHVCGLWRLNSNSSSCMTDATKCASKPKPPTPMGGMDRGVTLWLCASWKQLLSSLLRTCKNVLCEWFPEKHWVRNVKSSPSVSFMNLLNISKTGDKCGDGLAAQFQHEACLNYKQNIQFHRNLFLYCWNRLS